jgi:hypothetical protein
MNAARATTVQRPRSRSDSKRSRETTTRACALAAARGLPMDAARATTVQRPRSRSDSKRSRGTTARPCALAAARGLSHGRRSRDDRATPPLTERLQAEPRDNHSAVCSGGRPNTPSRTSPSAPSSTLESLGQREASLAARLGLRRQRTPPRQLLEPRPPRAPARARTRGPPRDSRRSRGNCRAAGPAEPTSTRIVARLQAEPR